MSGVSCQACGLINFAGAESCRRCGAQLDQQARQPAPAPAPRRHRLLKSVARILALSGFIIFLWYASLIGTSEPVLFEQRQALDRSIAILDEKGFSTQVFILRNLVRFRSTDSWWNRKVGHASAFAATNFPVEIVTLYPSFFEQPVDDVERAAILLHESYHLMGYGEATAFERSWKDRWKLGWTKDKYQESTVWLNVREATARYSPHLFSCGPDQRADCTEIELPGSPAN
jgi:hypothetical protein